jgi:hypothetical protein
MGSSHSAAIRIQSTIDCRGGRHHRSLRAVLAAELRADDLALEELRRNHIDLEGLLLADLLVLLRLGLHLRGDQHDRLLHRELGEGLRRHRALLRRGFPLVGDRLPRNVRRRQLLQLLQLEQQLRPVERLAPARAEELLLQPGDLRPQDRVLLLQELVVLEGNRGAHRSRATDAKPPGRLRGAKTFSYRSYHALSVPRFRSMPPSKSASASGASESFLPAAAGHEKRPSSSRFASTHTPVPSQ